MVEQNYIVSGSVGLHARPASQMVALAQKYKSDITITKGERAINAKSIMGILSLGAGKGDSVQISINGIDEQQAMIEVDNFFNVILKAE